MLPDILQGLLGHAQDDRPLRIRQAVGRGVERRGDRGAGDRPDEVDRVLDGAIEAQFVQDRRTELADE